MRLRQIPGIICGNHTQANFYEMGRIEHLGIQWNREGDEEEKKVVSHILPSK
jgi:hypothetical protein